MAQKRKPRRRANPADLIELFDRIVRSGGPAGKTPTTEELEEYEYDQRKRESKVLKSDREIEDYLRYLDELISLPRHLLIAIADALKLVPKLRGGQSTSGREKVRDSLAIALARSRKLQLLENARGQGRALTADTAAWQAAKQISDGLDIEGKRAKKAFKSRLSAQTIRDRMDRRSRR